MKQIRSFSRAQKISRCSASRYAATSLLTRKPIWNRNFIDHVQITVAETLGVEQRGGYYEHAGALRDMIPNHLFQPVTLTAMEPPVSFYADAGGHEQANILAAIQPL